MNCDCSLLCHLWGQPNVHIVLAMVMPFMSVFICAVVVVSISTSMLVLMIGVIMICGVMMLVLFRFSMLIIVMSTLFYQRVLNGWQACQRNLRGSGMGDASGLVKNASISGPTQITSSADCKRWTSLGRRA